MKIHTVEGGSEAWHRARAGVITASNVKMIRAKVGGLTEQQAIYVNALRRGASEKDALAEAKYQKRPTARAIEQALDGVTPGDWSDWAKNYALKLAIERISGAPLGDDEFTVWQAVRGQKLEAEACMELELAIGEIVEPAGFITTDDGKFGATADGWIRDHAGAEFKCFLSPSKLRPILLEDDFSDVVDQCQLNMELAGRTRWYSGLYLPQLRCIDRHFTMQTISRDDDYISEMWEDLLAFDAVVEGYVAQLSQRGRLFDDYKPDAIDGITALERSVKPAALAPADVPADLFN